MEVLPDARKIFFARATYDADTDAFNKAFPGSEEVQPNTSTAQAAVVCKAYLKVEWRQELLGMGLLVSELLGPMAFRVFGPRPTVAKLLSLPYVLAVREIPAGLERARVDDLPNWDDRVPVPILPFRTTGGTTMSASTSRSSLPAPPRSASPSRESGSLLMAWIQMASSHDRTLPWQSSMRISWVVTSVFAALFAASASASERRVFAPLAAAVTNVEEEPGTGFILRTYWISSLSIYNNGGTPAKVRVVRGYGAASIASHCYSPGIELRPGEGGELNGSGCTGLFGGPVGYVELAVEAGIVATAGVDRVLQKSGCPGVGDGTDISLGKTGAPVYSQPFPTGRSVVMGEIDLGQPNLPESCATPDQAHIRRVNLTMLNTGDAAATFRVKVVSLSGRTTLFSTEYTVGPGEVFQANRLPIPLIPDLHTPLGRTIRVWMTVSADQPFLCYASSIFEPAEAETMPFEVFPAHLDD